MTSGTRTAIDVLVIEPGSWKASRQTITPDLSTFQGLVGGMIEALDLTDEVGAYINEEGKLEGLARNEAADRLVRKALSRSGRGLIPGDFIVGPLVLTGQPDDEGETTGVPESVLDLLRDAGVTIAGEGPSPFDVEVPERIEQIEVKATGRDHRTRTSRLATGEPDLFLEVSTHHDKDRKEFWSTAQGVRVGGNFSRYSLMDFVRVRREPTPRFSATGVDHAHTQALAVVGSTLIQNPSAFAAVLAKTPKADD